MSDKAARLVALGVFLGLASLAGSIVFAAVMYSSTTQRYFLKGGLLLDSRTGEMLTRGTRQHVSEWKQLTTRVGVEAPRAITFGEWEKEHGR